MKTSKNFEFKIFMTLPGIGRFVAGYRDTEDEAKNFIEERITNRKDLPTGSTGDFKKVKKVEGPIFSVK